MKHPSNHCTLHAILLLHPPSLKIKGEIAPQDCHKIFFRKHSIRADGQVQGTKFNECLQCCFRGLLNKYLYVVSWF